MRPMVQQKESRILSQTMQNFHTYDNKPNMVIPMDKICKYSLTKDKFVKKCSRNTKNSITSLLQSRMDDQTERARSVMRSQP